MEVICGQKQSDPDSVTEESGKSTDLHFSAPAFDSKTVIDIDVFINRSWVDTRWQYTFTHKQYTEQHK